MTQSGRPLRDYEIREIIYEDIPSDNGSLTDLQSDSDDESDLIRETNRDLNFNDIIIDDNADMAKTKNHDSDVLEPDSNVHHEIGDKPHFNNSCTRSSERTKYVTNKENLDNNSGLRRSARHGRAILREKGSSTEELQDKTITPVLQRKVLNNNKRRNNKKTPSKTSLPSTQESEDSVTTTAAPTDEICTWTKTQQDDGNMAYDYLEGAIAEELEDCYTPTEYFLTLLDPILDDIVFQSNLYATQKGKNLKLNRDELCSFIGINFLMGYHKLPRVAEYWSTSPDLRVQPVIDTMTRNRFWEISAYLHVNDNSLIPRRNTDKVYKVRPMIDGLNKRFRAVYNGTRKISIDESMIAFKARSSLKQYNPMKPIKRGYKLWVVADQRAYILEFRVYQGKNEASAELYKNFGLGERVVLELTEKENGKNRIVYFDNYFTSIPLLERLKQNNVLACGTIRLTRKGIPEMQPDRNFTRGKSDFRVSSTGISVYKWQDNKMVYFASNFHGSNIENILRKRKDGTSGSVECPTVVKDYNMHMGGVDKADQLRSLYCVDRKAKKWWSRVFWGFLDIAFINAYVLHNQFHDATDVFQFRRDVARGLMNMTKPAVKRLPGRPRKVTFDAKSEIPVVIPNKKRKVNPSVPDDVRFANIGVHFPVYQKSRHRCEECSLSGIESRTSVACKRCRVALCFNNLT